MKELLLKLVASDRKHLDGALLFLRLFIGGMILSHGWTKLATFSVLSATFPDPLGVGSTLSLLLYVFLLWGGAGSYSLDEWIRRRIIRREIAR